MPNANTEAFSGFGLKAIGSSRKLALLCMAMIISGCEFSIGFQLGAEDKINSAFPVADAIQGSRAALLDLANDLQRKEIEGQYRNRLKLRALGCSKNYSPSWYATVDSVRKSIGGNACFIEADKEINTWLSLRRAGILLGKQPISPIPSTAPAFIIAKDSIQNARFAANAGVVLFDTQRSIEIVSFNPMTTLYSETKGSTAAGALSPNGRLFTIGVGDRVKIKDSESGAELAEIPNARPSEFFWLDDQVAIYNKSGASKPVLVDFLAGKELPLEMISSGIQRAVRVPGSDNQFVVFTYRGVSKIQLSRIRSELNVELIADKPITGVYWSSDKADITADGTRYFSASPKLTLVSLASLDIETISFQPFTVQTGMATSDPDKLYLNGYAPASQFAGPREFVYSISNSTLMPIDRSGGVPQRYIYIPTLRKQAVISDNKVALSEGPPTLESIPRAKFVIDVVEAVEKQQALQGQPRPLPGVPYATADAYRQAHATSPISGVADGSSLLASLVSGAQVEAVGVYQGSGGGPRTVDGRKLGYVEIRIRRSAKPIVLILSSYESVRWMLISESGARLAAVLVSGYHPSQVVGAGSVRTVMIGNTYAYRLGSVELKVLGQEVAK